MLLLMQREVNDGGSLSPKPNEQKRDGLLSLTRRNDTPLFILLRRAVVHLCEPAAL